MSGVQKLRLLAGCSALAMGVALTGSAHAFNEVNWTWDATVTERVTKRVEVDITLDPTGMVMLEDLQVSIGDLTAVSEVSGVYNWQNPEGEGTTTQTMAVDLGDFTATGGFPAFGGSFNIAGTASDGDYEITPMIVSSNSSGGSLAGASFTTTWDLGTIMVEFEVPDGGDTPLVAAEELPEVISAATAVANNTSITSDTMVELHEGQFAFGDGSDNNAGPALAAAILGVELAENGVNSNLVGAGVLGTLAVLGGLEKANISATSTVSNIMNASVDSSATAVANNLTVNVEGDGGDRLMIGDAVQFAYADLSAMSNVSAVNLYNYTGLGALDRPIVNSIATAVGNNKSITVSAPVVPTP